MNTKIRILGWEASGLRCPDHKLSFELRDDTVWPITLIQMPNGTGKTTVLNLLRGTLSGDFEKNDIWSKEKIEQLQKRGNDGDDGFFQVVLLVGNKRLTIGVNFDFAEGTARYTTSYGSGQKTGFVPPRSVQRFFRSGFVNFFAFDGELAEQLLSYDHTNAETAIEDLFQLSIFEGLKSAIDDYWDKQTSDRTATNQRGLSRRDARVQNLRERLRKLKEEKDEEEIRKGEVSHELAMVKEKFEERIRASKKNAELLQNSEGQYQRSCSNVDKLSVQILGNMRGPGYLSTTFEKRIIDFKNSLDRAKLPESAAKEFFEELSQEDQCVCGREMTDDAREMILEHSGRYLASDEVSLLNAMKSDIEQNLGGGRGGLYVQNQEALKRLIMSTRERQEKKNAMEMAQQEAVGDDPVLRDAQKKIQRLETSLGEINNQLDKYDSLDDQANDESTFGIPIVERRLADAERKLAEIAHTIGLKDKRDILVCIVRRAQEIARERLVSDVVIESNQRIHDLMPHNNVRIQTIDRCLKLEGQEGGSVGETLCVAYAFLSTLFSRTSHELPFVVDSPAGSIDRRVRQQVAELVPKLSEQFIAFTISTEREAFLDSLELGGANIQYITFFRRSVENAGVYPSKTDKVIESIDGKTVIGRDFFHGFHLDSED